MQLGDQVIAEEFSHMGDATYLDHAGATLYSRSQMASLADCLTGRLYGNPHSNNPAGRLSADTVSMARYRVLQFVNANPAEYAVVFTSGATASLAVVADLFDFNASVEKAGRFVYLKESHTSVVGMRRRIDLNSSSVMVSAMPHTELHVLEQRTEPTEAGCVEASRPRALVVLPAQCNFSGRKYPLSWVTAIQNGCLDDWDRNGEHMISGCRTERLEPLEWFCMLDAASYAATNPLNLTDVLPDFVCLSFYKIFGFPTGLGALLVRRSSVICLGKKYFGGGTVGAILPGKQFESFRDRVEDRLEDGTVSYLDMIALINGFDSLRRLAISMSFVAQNVFEIARYAYQQMSALQYDNASPLVEVYSDNCYDNIEDQGGIVSFNVLDSDGGYVGHNTVERFASLHNIILRTGCFCNVGACQRFLQLSNEDIMENLARGHICGDEMDLVDGKPTGAVRISFGYMSRHCDVDKFIQMLRVFFLHTLKPVLSTSQSNSMETSKVHNGCLSGIHVYPIKSCSGFRTSCWPLTSSGLLYDRQWMITRNGVALTQKRLPRLCKIVARVDLVTGLLTLNAIELDSFLVPSITVQHQSDQSVSSNLLCQIRVCGRLVLVSDCGTEVADWLQHVLETEDVKLCSFKSSVVTNGRDGTFEPHPAQQQQQRYRKEHIVSLNNQSALTLISETSVAVALPREPLRDAVARFRANLVVQSHTAPFSEHQAREMRFFSPGCSEPHLVLPVIGPVNRCQVICIDQSTGEKCHEPLVAVARSVGDLDSAPLRPANTFGIALAAPSCDDVFYLSTGDVVDWLKY